MLEQGTKVCVVKNSSNHDFKIGDIAYLYKYRSFSERHGEDVYEFTVRPQADRRDMCGCMLESDFEVISNTNESISIPAKWEEEQF